MFFYSLQLALNHNVHDLISKNWNISEYKQWRKSESVDNTGSEETNNVSLYCLSKGLVTEAEYTNTKNCNILLYTDSRTQFKLMKLKGASWYGVFDADAEARIAYNNIKDTSWPNINTIQDLANLNEKIITELTTVYDFPVNFTDSDAWAKRLSRHLGTNYNTIKISKQAEKLIGEVDYKFLLQDVVKTKFKCVTDALGLEHTQEVADHIDQWVALHPKNIQELLYKDI